MQSDKRLLKLLRRGVGPAFDELVNRYQPALVAYAGGIVGRDRAEDVVQESLIKAHSSLMTGNRDIEPKPWLYRIVRNTALNDVRDNRKHGHAELHDGDIATEEPQASVERREELAGMVAAVSDLPEAQRKALVGRELSGLTHAEIAQELQVSTGATKQLIHRARLNLRNAMGALIPLPLIAWLAAGASAAEAAAGGAAAMSGGSTAASGAAGGAAAGASAGGATAAGGVLSGVASAGAAKIAVAAVIAGGGIAGGVAVERSVTGDGTGSPAAQQTGSDPEGSPAAAALEQDVDVVDGEGGSSEEMPSDENSEEASAEAEDGLTPAAGKGGPGGGKGGSGGGKGGSSGPGGGKGGSGGGGGKGGSGGGKGGSGGGGGKGGSSGSGGGKGGSGGGGGSKGSKALSEAG